MPRVEDDDDVPEWGRDYGAVRPVPRFSLARVLTQLLLFHWCAPTAKEEQHVPEHVVDEPFADERPQTEGSRRTRPPVLTITRTAEKHQRRTINRSLPFLCAFTFGDTLVLLSVHLATFLSVRLWSALSFPPHLFPSCSLFCILSKLRSFVNLLLSLGGTASVRHA